MAPRIHIRFGGADLFHPVPELEGQRDTETGDAVAFGGIEACQHLGDTRIHEGQHARGRRIAIGFVELEADATGEVHENEVGAAAADLEAERQNAVGIEAHRDRRLADTAALGTAAREQPVFFESAHDDGDGSAEGGLGARSALEQQTVPPHQRQNQPLVIGANTRLIGSSHRVHDAGG